MKYSNYTWDDKAKKDFFKELGSFIDCYTLMKGQNNKYYGLGKPFRWYRPNKIKGNKEADANIPFGCYINHIMQFFSDSCIGNFGG
jgi:hypothetical protein